jgi:hypothetical protein
MLLENACGAKYKLRLLYMMKLVNIISFIKDRCKIKLTWPWFWIDCHIFYKLLLLFLLERNALTQYIYTTLTVGATPVDPQKEKTVSYLSPIAKLYITFILSNNTSLKEAYTRKTNSKPIGRFSHRMIQTHDVKAALVVAKANRQCNFR